MFASPNNDTAATGIAKFSNAGVALSPAGGFAAGTITQGAELAIDGSNNAWVESAAPLGTTTPNGSIAQYSPAGATLAGPFTDGGITLPNDVVIDGTGRVYTSNSAVSVRSRTGVAISPATGYTAVSSTSNDCCLGAAIDGSGNLWLGGANNMYVMIGLASPVVTPIVKAVVNGTIATLP